MDRQYIRDHQVLERYLTGTLTADEEQAFEEAYLGDGELLDQVQAAERLREGVKELEGAGRLERIRRLPHWQRMLASPRYAAAATVLLAVSLGFSTSLYRENQDLRASAYPSTSALTRLVPLVSLRGADEATVPAPADDEWLVFQIDAGSAQYDSYRAALDRLDGGAREQIWSRANLEPTGGEIAIGLPGRILRPGRYEARLEGRRSDSPADQFEEVRRTQFRLVPRD
jgi:hypothetical protein